MAFLKKEITRATFHSMKNLSVAIDPFKIPARGSAIAGAAVFSTLAEISKIPVALEIVNLVISL